MKEIQEPYIGRFVDGFYADHQGQLGELERQVRAEGLPVARRDVIALLEFLCQTFRPKRILEIGTCVGFSALVMRSVCPPDTQITTVDRYAYMIDRAKENFKAFAAENISLIEGQAAEVLPQLAGPYDLIFLDAAKAQYPRFLPECVRLLERGGIFIADNVLCGGIVAGAPLESRRDKTTVTRMHEFLEMVKSDERLTAQALLPVGDGVVLFRKKEQ